jgi:hypothetical protein
MLMPRTTIKETHLPSPSSVSKNPFPSPKIITSQIDTIKILHVVDLPFLFL